MDRGFLIMVILLAAGALNHGFPSFLSSVQPQHHFRPQLFSHLGAARIVLSSTTQIKSKTGANVTLPCPQAEHVFPGWRGPGIQGPDVTYSYPQDPEFGVPSLGSKVSRVFWDPADNKSLIITDLIRNDSGTYICELRLGEQIYFALDVKVLPKPEFIGTDLLNGTRNIIRGQENVSLILSCVTNGTEEQHRLNMFEVDDLTTPLDTNVTVTTGSDGTFTVMQSMLIVPGQDSDRKKYVCRSMFDPPNQATSWSDEVELYLKLRPSILTLISKPGVENQTNATIECQTSGFRPVDSLQVWWKIDGTNHTGNVTSTSDTSTETFNVTSVYRFPVNRQDLGKTIDCYVLHETLDQPLVGSTTIDVHYPADVATLTGNTTGILANNVSTITLTCTASDSNPAPNFTWNIGGQQMLSDKPVTVTDGEDDGRMTSQVLEIIADRRLDGSEAYCVLHNNFDDVIVESNRKILDLLYNPVVAIEGPSEIVEGDSGVWTLRCTADSDPEPTFTWYHDNTELVDNIVTSGYISEYTISTSERKRAGNYTCLANNGMNPEGRAEFTLVVNHKSEITSFSSITIGDETKLVCKIVSTPPAQMSIVKDGRVIYSGSWVTELEYRLQHLDCLDSGTYSCTAFNQYNAGTFDIKSVNVTAACNPHTIEQVYGSFDDTITLSSTLMSYPIPTVDQVTWSKYENEDWAPINGGYLAPRSENVVVCSYNVTLVAGSDFGYYRVEIADGQTSNFAQMFHVVRKDAMPEMLASVQSDTSDRTPIIHILLPFVGVVVGILLTAVGCRLRNGFNGKRQANSLYSPRSKRDSGKDLIYEDIDEIKMRAQTNLYSDISDPTNHKGPVHGHINPVMVPPPITDKTGQIKRDSDTYLDMNVTTKISVNSTLPDDYLRPTEYSKMERRASFDSGKLLDEMNSNYVCMQKANVKHETDADDNKQETYANEGKI